MNEKIKEYKELFGEQRFHSISTWLKREFGEKTIKLAIDGGFNRARITTERVLNNF